MAKNGIRAGKGAGSSVGSNITAAENNRSKRTAQAARQRQRLVALARELEELFDTLYGLEHVNCIYLNGCWLGAHYSDHSEGGVVEYRHCEPRL